MLYTGFLVDGKYRILSQIGKGGMSIVWLAVDERLNRLLTIKEICKTDANYDKIAKENLFAEVNILMKLEHPGLPMIFDIIDTDDTLIIVMTYVEGKPLSTVLEESGAQPEVLVIDWAKQLCNILNYLHSNETPIIYRDMKPSNIMLQPNGHLVLIDFGSACYQYDNSLSLGTKGYAAPEQYDGNAQLDARTDIYALGITLHHLVTGKNPTEPPYELEPIRHYNPALSARLEQIIKKCTEKDVNQRFQSILDLKYALEKNNVVVRLPVYKRILISLKTWWKAKLGDRQITAECQPATSSLFVSNPTDMLRYNAELFLHLQSDMNNKEI